MIDELFAELNSRMQKAVEGLAKELATVRVGRATPALVDNVMVQYHGIPTPLRQIATISIPEANLIVIQPWDRTLLREVEKAILAANIGLNPTNDGNVIRLIVPPVSEERRKEVAKLISRKVEERKVAIRNVRRDSIEKLREMEKNKEISQDELRNYLKKVDLLTDAFIEKVDEVGREKEKEIWEL